MGALSRFGAPAGSGDALGEHRPGHLQEAGHVRAVQEILSETVLFGGLCAHLVDVPHDPPQLDVDLLAIPETHGSESSHCIADAGL